MSTITLADILRSRGATRAAYRALNNRAEGYDPSEDGEMTLVRDAETTSDVAVYQWSDDVLVLVGTDGSGWDDSRWAVRVTAEGVDLGNEE